MDIGEILLHKKSIYIYGIFLCKHFISKKDIHAIIHARLKWNVCDQVDCWVLGHSHANISMYFVQERCGIGGFQWKVKIKSNIAKRGILYFLLFQF